MSEYRVLLMCKDCNKVYNGTGPLDYEKAVAMYYRTLMSNKDVCRNENCGKKLLPIIDEFTQH